MHGGSVAAVAERVAIACARTVVGEDKDIFLGELGISYLASAPPNVSVSFLPKTSRFSLFMRTLSPPFVRYYFRLYMPLRVYNVLKL